MLIGLVSDIHGNVFGLEAVLNALQKVKPDLILCAGDVVGYYPFVNETIDLLRQSGAHCVMGNHDAILTGHLVVDPNLWQKYMLDYALEVIRPDNKEWLEKLPISLNIENQSIEVYHGSPWNPLAEYIYPDYPDFNKFGNLISNDIILGHTHWPLHKQVGKVSIINPGSCGQPRDFKPGASYALLSFEEQSVSFYRKIYDLQPLIDVLTLLGCQQSMIDILKREKIEVFR